MNKKLKLFTFCVSLLLICILLVFISQKKYDEDLEIIYNVNMINYYLDNDYNTILDGEYEIYNSYTEYHELYFLIDEYKSEFDDLVNSIKNDVEELKIDEDYFEKNSLLVFEFSIIHKVINDIEVIDICKNEDVLNVYIDIEYSGVVGGGDGVLFFVEIDKDVMKSISDVNFEIFENDTTRNAVAYKPIIYLYPNEKTDIEVNLGYEDKLLVSYPKYNSGWKVSALPDGTLLDYNANRELYALYYESQNVINFKVLEDGFVVQGKEVVPFLEEKLELLGLNARESEEFIIYWLPILENNKYNYIRFATMEEIDRNMPLEITPVPDTIIRILMTFKALDEPIVVNPQVLHKVERKGYTAVEWGATVIK